MPLLSPRASRNLATPLARSSQNNCPSVRVLHISTRSASRSGRSTSVGIAHSIHYKQGWERPGTDMMDAELKTKIYEPAGNRTPVDKPVAGHHIAYSLNVGLLCNERNTEHCNMPTTRSPIFCITRFHVTGASWNNTRCSFRFSNWVAQALRLQTAIQHGKYTYE